MPVFNLALKHGQTQQQAQAQLETAVRDITGQAGHLVQRTEWSADRNRVKLFGTGFEVEMWVDPAELHVTGDIPVLMGLLGLPMLSNLKQIVQRHFPKQLT